MERKNLWILIAIIAIVVIVTGVYALKSKTAILGSPISCYVRCNSNDNCGTGTTSKFCNGTNACTTSSSYICNSPGTPNSSCFGMGNIGCSPCANGCSNGNCIQGNQTTNSTKSYTCKDSDGGIIYNVKGLTTEYYGGEYNKASYDACVTNKTSSLVEYYCSNNRLASVTYICPSNGTCTNGACPSGGGGGGGNSTNSSY